MKKHEHPCCATTPKHLPRASRNHQRSSMASLIWVSLILAFTCSFSSCSAEIFSSRKGLRSKEVIQEAVIQLGRSIQFNRIDPSRVIQLSWQPRSGSSYIEVFFQMRSVSTLFLWHLARKKSSLGNDGDSENNVMNRPLTSLEDPLNKKDDIAVRIEERISAWTFLPQENSRPLQVLHYGLEEAKQNYDYFGNKSTLGLSEPLMATVILYLSNVTQGGGILFTNSEYKNPQLGSKIWSDCTESSYALRPIKGNAILFFTTHPNATPDKSSSHARCPVLEGEMWCATKFFHVRAVKEEKILFELDECTDEDENCPRWASVGECQRNPTYMIGSPDYYGTCRKSCNAC
ncbi:hypothetical protein L1049_020114 [Liquidambar formosana]|uniref:procollagen-proline 4-dioxygenase n=1 Tax=Liquidambar formosana TaxID=63359 RepID=A0AAP0S6Z2_LIQFO